MSKNFKYIIFFIIIFILKNSNSSVINNQISDKYNDIFLNKLLSSEDVVNYREIFEYQNICEWKKANRNILKLNNKILMGHVLAQKYLHPRCYRSEFIELTYWLKKYNDHPQAKNIYKLAIKRMPKGYKSPTKPTQPIGIKSEKITPSSQNKSYKSIKKLSKNQRIEKQKLLNAIKSRVNKGWPTGAVNLINQRDVSVLLDQVEIDQQKELIAKGYFLANKNELAIKYSSEALNKSAIFVPYAGWTAGLSAWRLERYQEAADFFSNFSISLKDDVWHQASGAFWASRSYSKLDKYEDINFWLNRAAKNPESFYGILANNILGINDPFNWGMSVKKNLNKPTYFHFLAANVFKL